MTITLKKTEKKSCDYKSAKALLVRSFPPEERPPASLLMHWSKKENIDFLSAYDNDKWIGFIYIATHKDLVYVFLFAVDEAVRGHGYGSAILTAIKDKYKGCRIFLAIEELDESSENYPERIRRSEFYERNGFSSLKLKMCEAKMVYDVLGIGGPITQAEYRALIESVIGKFWRRAINVDVF